MNNKRSKQAKRSGFRFQPRDELILQAIHENEGVLARRQIKALFWQDKSWRAMERRLSKLHQAGYLAWPSARDYRTRPIPEPVCWLGWQGALTLAGKAGINVPVPKNLTESQFRELQNDLRKASFRWVRYPRWSLLNHDLAVADFKLAVEQSLEHLPSYYLECWVSESGFRMGSDNEKVIYKYKGRDGTFKKLEKWVYPDAYFEVIDAQMKVTGDKYRGRFLLEMDMSTHDNIRFGREKAAAGAAYIRSPGYKVRFGRNSGRWLVVTNGGPRRLRNLMKQTRRYLYDVDDEIWFFFTTLQHIGAANIFTDPIWWQVDQAKPRPILRG